MLSNSGSSRTSLQALKGLAERDTHPHSPSPAVAENQPPSVPALQLFHLDPSPSREHQSTRIRQQDGQGTTLHFSGCLGSNAAPDLCQLHDKGQGQVSGLFHL